MNLCAGICVNVLLYGVDDNCNAEEDAIILREIKNKVKGYAGAITSVLLSVIGLLVIAQVVFGEGSLNVIGNLQGIVNGFVGEGASLAGLITLLVVLALIAGDKE